MESFKDAGLPEPLFHRLEQLGLKTPTPIQSQAIPIALEGRDILGSAQTGTGKTAAFGIPIVTHMMANSDGDALVLLPTRELAAQVMKQLKTFIGSSKIKTALLIGGEGMPRQLGQLKEGARLFVGTPGRVNDHLDRKSLKLHNTKYLVLDEVDRMLDMGFGVQLDAIAKHLTAERQTLMFSATMPSNIKNLSAKYLNNPTRISVGETHSPAKNVKQDSFKIIASEKPARLIAEIEARKGTIIVFVKTKHGADRIAEKLRKNGHLAQALHGDLKQSKRNRVTQEYREKKFRVLIATDVAARGLDIPHIEHVINYDLPQCAEDYIHRIGRTARAGAKGEAVSFLSNEDGAKWNAIQKLLDPNFKAPAGEETPRDYSKPKGKKKFGSNNKRFLGNKTGAKGKDAEKNGFKKKPFKAKASKKTFGVKGKKPSAK